jgi:membrane protease YdiL (CAAX protease family)
MSEASVQPQPAGTNAWQRFWNQGAWWKALIAAVAYLAVYEGFSAFVVRPLWGDRVAADLFADPQSVFFGLFVPILFGAVVLVAFVATLGWFRPVFRHQPIAGRGWMWVAVALVLVPIILRLLGIDYGTFDPAVIALTFGTGLLIGFTEEVLTRGIAVKIFRDAGHREFAVAVISAALFGLLHSANILLGQPLLTVLLTVVFAFGFGIMMYLVLRVTGNLIWPILIHGLTDPTTFLASGGIDVAVEDQSPLVALAGPFNLVFVLAAVVALFFISGRVKSAGNSVS